MKSHDVYGLIRWTLCSLLTFIVESIHLRCLPWAFFIEIWNLSNSTITFCWQNRTALNVLMISYNDSVNFMGSSCTQMNRNRSIEYYSRVKLRRNTRIVFRTKIMKWPIILNCSNRARTVRNQTVHANKHFKLITSWNCMKKNLYKYITDCIQSVRCAFNWGKKMHDNSPTITEFVVLQTWNSFV